MRQVVFLILTVGTTLLWLGSAETASACRHCQGHSTGCSECGDVSGDCGDCGSACPRHHDCCLNPMKAVKAVLRVLGGSCACGGCDPNVYWGPYEPECDPCDRCGNHRSGPVNSYRSSSYVPQSYVPQGEVIHSAPSGGCNCDKGRVSQSVAPRPSSSYAASRSSGVRYETTATRSRTSSQGSNYASRSPAQGTYASRSSADPYAPRLISVTDEVVRPAAPAARTALTPLNPPIQR